MQSVSDSINFLIICMCTVPVKLIGLIDSCSQGGLIYVSAILYIHPAMSAEGLHHRCLLLHLLINSGKRNLHGTAVLKLNMHLGISRLGIGLRTKHFELAPLGSSRLPNRILG